MKKSTCRIVMAALAADETVENDQRAAAIAVLRERTTAKTPMPLLLTQAQVARLLGVSRYTVWRMTKEGQLPRVLVMASMRYRRSDIEDLVAGKNNENPD